MRNKTNFPSILAIGAFLLLPSFPSQLHTTINCDSVTVNAGADQIICNPGTEVSLAGTATGSVLRTLWSPGVLVFDSTARITRARVDTTTTFTFSAFSISTDNLISNGDFSQGSVGFTSDYTNRTGDGVGSLIEENQYAIDNNPRDTHRGFASCSDHTSGNGNMMIVNGSGSANNIWCQQINVVPGTDYIFTAWAASVTTENPARLQFSINGNLLGAPFQAAASTCTWNRFFATWNSGAETTAQICIANVNLTPRGNDFAIDDITFNEVCKFSDEVIIEVPQLNPDWLGASSYCANDTAFDLNTLLSVNATIGGTWLIDGINNNVFNPASLSLGMHNVVYQVNRGPCSESMSQSIEILPAPNSGAPLPAPFFCEGDQEVVNLADLLNNEDLGGSWSVVMTTGIPLISIVNGSVNIENLPAGNYSFDYTVQGNTSCVESISQVSFVINPLPQVDAGEDTSLDCLDQMASIGSSKTASGPNFNISWTSLNGNAVLDPDAIITEVDAPGTYILEVTNTSTNCTASDEVLVASNMVQIAASARVTPIPCDNTSAGGRIEVLNPSGGIAPYEFSINGSGFGTNAVFNNLGPGVYEIAIRDANQCESFISAEILTPKTLNAFINVNVNNDPPTIFLGDSVKLDLIINEDRAEIDSIFWFPESVNCPNCPEIIVSPGESTVFEVVVKGKSGCTTTASALVQVKKAQQLFFPNIFSPNNDGINDVFFINTGKNVDRIKSFKVLDRWGGLVFFKEEFAGNTQENGWDGTAGGQRVPPGVYVFVIEAILAGGQTIIEQGDITVVN